MYKAITLKNVDYNSNIFLTWCWLSKNWLMETYVIQTK
jgi:hypothetical protein